MISGENDIGLSTETRRLQTGEFLRTVVNTAIIDPSYTDPALNTDGYAVLEFIQEQNPLIEIRAEQVEALDAIQDARLSGQDRALIQMATGLGKTMVVAADVKRFLANKPKARVLFLWLLGLIQRPANAVSKVAGSMINATHRSSL